MFCFKESIYLCLGFFYGEFCYGVVKCGCVFVEVCSESGLVIGDVFKGFIICNFYF